MELASAAAEEPEALFDSGRSAAPDDGMFSDFEQSGYEEIDRSPRRKIDQMPIAVGEKQHPTLTPEASTQGTNNEKQPGPEGEARKRKRDKTDEEESTTLEQQLIEALEKNGKLISSQIESQNNHLRLDREQRNNHVNSFITVLNKLADALGRIADKF